MSGEFNGSTFMDSVWRRRDRDFSGVINLGISGSGDFGSGSSCPDGDNSDSFFGSGNSCRLGGFSAVLAQAVPAHFSFK